MINSFAHNILFEKHETKQYLYQLFAQKFQFLGFILRC